MSATKKNPLAETLNDVVDRASRDHDRSRKARKKDWDKGRRICHGPVNGIMRHAHSWCVDFIGTADELVEAGLARRSWFDADSVCRGVVFDGRQIELYRPEGDEYELTIPYERGGAKERRA